MAGFVINNDNLLSPAHSLEQKQSPIIKALTRHFSTFGNPTETEMKKECEDFKEEPEGI